MSTAQLYAQIEATARQVEAQIQKDNNFPDLKDLLGSQSHVSAVESTVPPPHESPRPILQKIDVIPLPTSLNALYSKSMPSHLSLTQPANHCIALEYKTFMGVFPEINRVWMTIDNNLYLWDYEDGYVAHLQSSLYLSLHLIILNVHL